MPDLFGWPVLLPAVLAAPFVLLPLAVWLGQSLPARPQVVELDLRSLPTATADYLMARTRELIALGFDEPLLLELPAAVANVAGYLIMLVDRKTGDKAMATVLAGTPNTGGAGLKVSYVEFSTRLRSGAVFDTLNAAELNAFRPGRQTVRTQVWGHADTAELLRLHRFVMRAHEDGSEPWVFPPGGGVEYLREYAFERSFDAQVARGWLYRSRDGRYYHPTVMGACLMSWGLLPPVSWVRRWRVKRQGEAALREMRQSQE